MDMIAEVGIDPLEIGKNILKEGEKCLRDEDQHGPGVFGEGWNGLRDRASKKKARGREGIAIGNKYTMPGTRSVSMKNLPGCGH
jgi:hypothetical protein